MPVALFPQPVDSYRGDLADFGLCTSGSAEKREPKPARNTEFRAGGRSPSPEEKVKNPARLGPQRGRSHAKRDSLQRVNGGAGGI